MRSMLTAVVLLGLAEVAFAAADEACCCNQGIILPFGPPRFQGPTARPIPANLGDVTVEDIGLITAFRAVGFADPAQKQTLLAEGISIAMTDTMP